MRAVAGGSARRRPILLIEDNPGDAMLVRLMFEEDGGGEGVDLICVERLAAAWDRLADVRDGCVLVDLTLPDADGLEAVEQLHGAVPELPIIVLTGRDDLGLAVEALQQGAQDYLIKGRVDRHVLNRAVRYAIERKRADVALAHQALHDPLTGLPNRILFVDRLDQALARAQRSWACVGVLFVDLDRFKVVNDSLGHAAGDRLLVDLSGRIQAMLRPTDTVARFGGDEFLVLCADMAGEDEPLAVAQRIAESLQAPFNLGGADVVLTASIGIALSSRGIDSAETLIRNADAAMYRAKERGRAGWVVFEEEIHRRDVTRLETEVALRKAVERGELRLHYQPIIDTDTGRLRAVEALVRWEHPTRGLIGPVHFIDLAEESGLIEKVGTWVLNEACRQAARWKSMWPPGAAPMMSVNVSRRQLVNPAIIGTVAQALDGGGLAPADLCLEITESALTRDPEATLAALRGLRSVGVTLSVDDFGTGSTTLGSLKHFPIDIIKVDRTFVAGLGSDHADAAITMSIVRLSQALGFQTVAEGVETAEQLDLLRTIGCDQVQGFHIGAPGPAGDAVRRWAPVEAGTA